MNSEKQHLETIKHLQEQITKLEGRKGTLNGNSESNTLLYYSAINQMPLGFCLNKIIYNKNQQPVDYIILEVNKAFEHLTGLKSERIIGKTAIELFPQLKSTWVPKFAEITQSGKSKSFDNFSFDLKNTFKIHVYAPLKDHFAFTLEKVEHEKSSEIGSKGPKEFYERIMEHLHEGIWVTNKNDMIYFTNRGMTVNTESQKEDILGKNILNDFDKVNIGNFNAHYLKAKTSLSPIEYEVKLLTLTGKEAVLAGWLVPLVKGNAFDGMICTVRNISEEKDARQKIRESEEKLRNIIEHSSNVFYSHTPEHVLTYISPQFKNLLGYSTEEANIKWTELTTDNPINKIGFELTTRAIETTEIQRPYELELRHKNGSLVWVEVREAPVVVNGKTISIVGALIDITEQKKIAKELLENQRGLRNLIDESPIPIAINSQAGDIEYLNHEFINTFGYTLKDIPRVDSWFELAYPDKKYREKIIKLWEIDLNKRIANGAQKTPFEANVTCKDGTTKFVQIVWSYIGEKLVLIFHNLTEHKVLEDKILQKNDELENALNELHKINKELQKATVKAKESDQLKSAFLANMSHEIRTPMNSIIGFSSLLAQPQTSAEKRKRYTDFIQKSGNHLLRIIDDIIDIAKIESNQLKIEKSYFAVIPFLQNTYDYHLQSSLMAANPELKLTLNFKLATNSLIVFTDPIRLKQVFDNLLTNSIKNTIKGSVEFGIHQLDENQITYYVSDTGVGIPERFKESIFKRFTQVETKTIKPGTGLGLSIIKGITSLLGGEIWFESSENVGTTFYVKFPIQPEE